MVYNIVPIAPWLRCNGTLHKVRHEKVSTMAAPLCTVGRSRAGFLSCGAGEESHRVCVRPRPCHQWLTQDGAERKGLRHKISKGSWGPWWCWWRGRWGGGWRSGGESRMSYMRWDELRPLALWGACLSLLQGLLQKDCGSTQVVISAKPCKHHWFIYIFCQNPPVHKLSVFL